LGGILVAAAVLVPGALAGPPRFERITVDDTFADDFLTEACGVPVTTHAEGHITIRTFSGGGTGPAEVVTVNVGLTATAGDNTYRFRDVGADQTQVKPDGSVIVMIIGQLPFDFVGVLKIDPATGEVLHEPHADRDAQLEEACAALTA
jgi:hypothetical protein